jgi:IstB-like ATP binding protein
VTIRRHDLPLGHQRLTDFNTDAVSGIAATLATLAAGAWIDTGEPVVLLRDSVQARPICLSASGLAACEQGRRVRYATTAALVNELAKPPTSGSCPASWPRYGRLDLLLPFMASASRCQYDGGARGPHSPTVK